MEETKQELEELEKETMLVPEEESVRVQSVIKMKENIVREREAEEALLERMMEEQKIVDELNGSLDENLLKTIELRKYNREVKDHMVNQVYRMNGISGDKLEGMENYRKAYYKGSAFAIFILSVVMVVITGLTHGFDSGISLFLSYFTALEGAVLVTEARRVWIVKAIFRVIYFLLFPAMMVIFVCYELGYPEYGQFLPYFSMAGLVIFVLAMLSYFTYNPYRKDKRYIRKAKDQMKDIERAAQKSVNQHRRAVQKSGRREEREAKRARKKAESEQLKKEWDVSGKGGQEKEPDAAAGQDADRANEPDTAGRDADRANEPDTAGVDGVTGQAEKQKAAGQDTDYAAGPATGSNSDYVNEPGATAGQDAADQDA